MSSIDQDISYLSDADPSKTLGGSDSIIVKLMNDIIAVQTRCEIYRLNLQRIAPHLLSIIDAGIECAAMYNELYKDN